MTYNFAEDVRRHLEAMVGALECHECKEPVLIGQRTIHRHIDRKPPLPPVNQYFHLDCYNEET